jgi:HK97 gp10 family phage protein
MADIVKITGLKEVADALRALPSELAGRNGGPIRGALFAATREMRDEAERLAPEDTGNLRRNIIIYRDRNPGGIGAAEHYVVTIRVGRRSRRVKRAYRLGKINSRLRALTGTDAWYGVFKEFGTAKMPAEPFLRPAFEARKMSSVSTFVRELRKGVARAAARAKARAGAK